MISACILTREVEQVRFRILEEAIRLLSRLDFRRLAFASVDSTAGMWCYCIPIANFRPTEAETLEIAAAYFGMPSPVAASMEGHTIWSKNGSARGVCGKYGQQLVSLQLVGDGWNAAHGFFKHALCQILRDLKVEFDCEVFGLFSALIPQGPRRASLDADTRRAAETRQGMVPNFKIVAGFVAHRLGIQAASSFLAELKFIPLGRTRYPDRVVGDGRHREAVRIRAVQIGPGMLAHARGCGQQGLASSTGE